mgnify:CR=1 FL=1
MIRLLTDGLLWYISTAAFPVRNSRIILFSGIFRRMSLRKYVLIQTEQTQKLLQEIQLILRLFTTGAWYN